MDESASVSYGGTSVLLSRQENESDAIYRHRSWSVAKAIENEKFDTLPNLVQLSKCYAYKCVMGVKYSDKLERHMRQIFE